MNVEVKPMDQVTEPTGPVDPNKVEVFTQDKEDTGVETNPID